MIQEITDKLIFIKNFYFSKKQKSQCQENEKTSYRLGENIVKDTSAKKMLSKIYKEVLRLNSFLKKSDLKMGQRP